MEGDDWVRERTVVMKLTEMTSCINARAISVAGSGGSCERDELNFRAQLTNVMQIEKEENAREASEQNGRSLKQRVGMREERKGPKESQRA